MVLNSSYVNSENELISFIFYFFLFTNFVNTVSLSKRPIRLLTNIWYFCYIITLPIALIELIFDIHLSTAIVEASPTMVYAGEIVTRKFASVTFANLNSYNTLLGYCLPFIILGLFCVKSKIELFIKILLFISYILITIINASRASFIAFSIASLYIFLNLSTGIKNKIYFTISLSLLFIPILTTFGDIILLRFIDSGVNDLNREILILNSFQSLIEKPYGVGPGNFKTVMENRFLLDMTAPHNLFLELGVQYGLQSLLIFLIFPLIYFLRSRKISTPPVRLSLLASLLTFPIISVIDSGYLNSPFLILYISSISALSIYHKM